MNNEISRRRWLGLSAGAVAAAATGTNWVFKLDGSGNVVKAETTGSAKWKPAFFTRKQAEGVANLVDAIIPTTNTPGARDARVHEYIDLVLSVGTESTQERFLGQLKWLEKHSKSKFRKNLGDLSPEECTDLLEPLSDLHGKHPEDLKPGAAFFRDLKTRTIFGYYTSLEGRVEELGLPAEVGMESFEGCRHSQGEGH